MELMPSDFSFDDDDEMEDAGEVQEMPTVQNNSQGEGQTAPMEAGELERLADLLSQQTYLAVSPDLRHRRDWAILRSWKAMVTREQLPLLEQYE